jgi:hypothetical protein
MAAGDEAAAAALDEAETDPLGIHLRILHKTLVVNPEFGIDAEVEVGSQDCYMRLKFEDPPLDALLLMFPEGRPAALQKELCSHLMRSALAPYAVQAMTYFHTNGSTEVKAETPMYYMLCEDEELGVDEDGSQQGDLKLRRRCLSWRVVIFASQAGCLVDFSGIQPDGDRVGAGFFLSSDTVAESFQEYEIYRYEGLEARALDDARQADITRLCSLIDTFEP